MIKFRIKEVMEERGIKTQKALAEKMGVTENSLSLSLKRTPSVGTLEKISKALQVDIRELFESSIEDSHQTKSGIEFNCPYCGTTLEVKIKRNK